MYGSVINDAAFNDNTEIDVYYPSAILINQGVKTNYTGVNISSIEAQL